MKNSSCSFLLLLALFPLLGCAKKKPLPARAVVSIGRLLAGAGAGIDLKIQRDATVPISYGFGQDFPVGVK